LITHRELFEYTGSNGNGTGNRRGGDSTGSGQQQQRTQQQTAADTGLLDITQL